MRIPAKLGTRQWGKHGVSFVSSTSDVRPPLMHTVHSIAQYNMNTKYPPNTHLKYAQMKEHDTTNKLYTWQKIAPSSPASTEVLWSESRFVAGRGSARDVKGCIIRKASSSLFLGQRLLKLGR